MEDNTTTTDTQPTDTPPTPDPIEAAIDDAVEAVNTDPAAPKNAAPAEDQPAAPADAPDASAGEDKPADAPAAPDAPDYSREQALFERAVKAGIPVKDVLSFPTYDVAERMVAIAEKAAGISSDLPNKDEQSAGAGTPTDELAAAIEEMEKDEGYDPKLLTLLKGMYNENKKLRTARETADRTSSFDQQFGTLDDAVRSHVDAPRKSQLKSKFDMLTAGYKAQGIEVSEEAVFQEAAKLALGDLMGQAAEERKTAALAQRKNLALARPGGENGHYNLRENGPATEEDIASEIWGLINK